MDPLIKISGSTEEKAEKPSLVKTFPKGPSKNTLFMVGGALLVVLAGVATGWFISGKPSVGGSKSIVPGVTQSANEAGIADEATFRDNAEGTLVEGGIEGEGTHHLDRGPDKTKYVYLTSTVIDLQSFVGKKVQVWGETVTGKKAGWLMDVGKIKVVE